MSVSSIEVKIDVSKDPLFCEFIKLAGKNPAFESGMRFLMDEKKLFVLQYFPVPFEPLNMRVTFHFTDEAMQLFYKHKGV